MSEIEHITDTEFGKLLQQVHLGKLDLHVTYSHIVEWQDMPEELLGILSAPADDTFKGACPNYLWKA